MKNRIIKISGFGMLEIVVGVTIISLALFGLVTVAQISMKVSEETVNNTKSAYLLEEGVEAVKIMRDTDWTNIASSTPGTYFYLNFNGTTWSTTTSNALVDGMFERKFVLQNVNRDEISQDIVSTGGVLDENTKKLTVLVSWKFRNSTTTKSISTYITNLFN